MVFFLAVNLVVVFVTVFGFFKIAFTLAASAVKTYKFSTHKGFCHNFPMKTRYYHTGNNRTKSGIKFILQNIQVIFTPFYMAYTLNKEFALN